MDIAIIGIGLRFPGANNLKEYHQLLTDGAVLVRDFPEERKQDIQEFLDFYKAPKETFYKAGFLEDIKLFDPEKFKIKPKEAQAMNPVSRLFLTVCDEAIVSSGMRHESLRGSDTGVFLGMLSEEEHISYGEMVKKTMPELAPFIATGNLNSVVAGRVNYIFGLKGPALTIDTSCSSSLVAVHMACEAIRKGDCDQAFAGGAHLILVPSNAGLKLGIESEDGLTRAFDEQGNGTGVGEGIACLLLKRLDKAQVEGNNIFAVIKGSAINSDGASMGLTAPNPAAQTEVVVNAWKSSDINPAQINYIEAHGTGTMLGDPIEINGLKKAFSSYTDEKQFCRIGSVKNNLGHLFAAAGIAGIIKIILMLKNQNFVIHPNFKKENPLLKLDNSPLYISRDTSPWVSRNQPRMAGISSFGISGTNCHMVLQEFPSEIKEFTPEQKELKKYWFEVPQQSKDETFDLKKDLLNLIAELSGYEIDSIDTKTDFFNLGIDSVILIIVKEQIEKKYNVEIPLSFLLKDGANIEQLEQRITKSYSKTDQKIDTPKDFIPFSPVEISNNELLNENQRDYIARLVQSIVSKTGISKEKIQSYRKVLANNRNIAGFRPILKEICYQISITKGDGAYFIDADGNRMLDLTMGFGIYLFGHNYPEIKAEIEKALNSGLGIGPMSLDAFQVAEKITKLTGCDRVAFYNSGTEAVMVALRLARASTKKEKIVIFSGSYHGTYDGILAMKNMLEKNEVLPIAPGISPSMIKHIMVLDYGKEESLKIIEDHADSIAAVLTEPVQSRKPNLQPRKFLKELRRITLKNDIALIFDEIITGFRIAVGGAQAFFGVEADITTYGKIIGGGMPLGVVAGKAKYLDAIDGGYWTFGDHSMPEKKTTFVAGTFNQHPLTMAASLMVLKTLEQQGIEMINTLNSNASQLINRLNDYFLEKNYPLRIEHFGSLFRFTSDVNLDLFYAELINRKIYIWEGRNCFISSAHKENELNYIYNAVVDSLEALERNGFLSESLTTLSLLPYQKNILNGGHYEKEDYSINIAGTIYSEQTIDLPVFKSALIELLRRHEILRAKKINHDGQFISNFSIPDLTIRVIKNREEGEAYIKEQVKCYRYKFPYTKYYLLILDDGAFYFSIVSSHLCLDGWSVIMLIEELGIIYDQLKGFVIDSAVVKNSLTSYVRKYESDQIKGIINQSHQFWQAKKFQATSVSAFRNVDRTYTSKRFVAKLPAELKIHLIAKKYDCNEFALLLIVFANLVGDLVKESQVVITLPVSGQISHGFLNTAGPCLSRFPYHHNKLDDFQTQLAKLKAQRTEMIKYPYLDEGATFPDGRFGDVVFNYDQASTFKGFSTNNLSYIPVFQDNMDKDLFWNIIKMGEDYIIEADYNLSIFTEIEIKNLIQSYIVQIQALSSQMELNLR